MSRCRQALPLAAVVLCAAGCGSSPKKATPPTTTTTTAATTATQPALTAPTQSTTTANGPGPLQAEATATAAGDIPDNQVFLSFRDAPAHYSMKYPEGWAQQGAGKNVTFRDKNNIVRIVVAASGPLTKASIQSDTEKLHIVHPLQATTISGSPAFKVSYSTVSAANAVTGKRVNLVVDRYYLWHGGQRAVVDLGTPVGVDNVDAYRMMIESFRWS